MTMTATIAVDMDDAQDLEQFDKPDRRYISRYLLVLANDPDFEQALIALVANGGRGKIELTYNSGRLNNVDLKLRLK